MKLLFAFGISLLALGTVLPHAALAAETAKGHMTFNNTVISLTNARAIETPSPEGGNYVRVVVSDRPVSAADIKVFPDALLGAINAGKLNALSFLIVENNGVHSVDIYSSLFGDGASETLSAGNVLEVEHRDASHIVGHLHIESSHKFDENGLTFSYDFTFDAPIQPND
jgi:hypothetical protein